MAQKRTRVKAPYTPQELNQARFDVFGSRVGRALTRIDITYTEHVLKTSGNGTVGLHSGILRKLTDSTSPGFNLLADPGDWLVIGGEWLLNRNTGSYDRAHYANGAVNVGTPSLFTDTAFGGFTSADVGRWVFIYKGANIGFYQITAFVGATQVTLGAASFSTETDLLWGFVDPKDNWGTYEVEQGLSATECLIVDTDEFPIGAGGADSGLLWALVTPPKVTLAPGFKFMHNSVIVEEDSSIDVPFPAGILSPSTPIAFLYAETQDNRQNSPINYRISYGQVPTRNAVILATSVRDHTGQFTQWLSCSELSVERNRALLEAFVSSDPERGYLSNAPVIEMDYVQWPPRLTVKPRGVQNGGYHPPSPIVTGAGIVEDRYEDPTLNVLDVPLYPPISGDRIDKIVLRQRRVNDQQLDELEGVASNDRPLSEGTLEYRTGIANLGYGADVDHDGAPLKERTSNLSQIEASTDSDHCLSLANEYGVYLYAYTDDKVASPADGLKIRAYGRDGGLAAQEIVIAPQDLGISQIKGAVDSQGWFWLCWLENIAGNYELWGCVLDPYGGQQIVSADQISGGDAVLDGRNHGVCMSLMQQATFYWIESGGNLSRWVHLSHDGSGAFTGLGAEASITGNSADFLAVTYQWDTGRVYIAELAGGGGDLAIFIKASDYSDIADYVVSLDTSVGTVDNGTVGPMELVRNHKDDIYLVLSATIASSVDGSHLFAARVNSDSAKLHPVTTKRTATSYTINNLSAAKDGKILVSGMYDAEPFLVAFTERLQAVVETTTIFAPPSPNVPVSFSAAYVPKHGDVFCVSQYDDTANKHLALGVANIAADYNLPLGHYGYDPSLHAPDGDIELAEVFIPLGALPDRPGLGMHLSPDTTPNSGTLAIDDATAARLTDSDRATAIPAVATTSVGMMNTSSVEAIGLIDHIESDGFDPAADPFTNIQVWRSSDNSSWTQVTIQDIYRISGMTYIVFDQVTDKYIKVYFVASLEVPAAYKTPYNTEQANIIQMRCFQNRASVNVSGLRDSDWFYLRGARIRHKSISNYGEIHVGDGASSFGKYLGAEGIQKAIQEASKLSSDSHRARSFPRKKVTVKVGPGAYIMSKPLHFIPGVDIKFAKGAVLYDGIQEETYLSVYSSGYNTAAYSLITGTRTLYLSRCMHTRGVDIGCTVKIADGTNTQYLKVARISPDGYQVHLDEPITVPTGLVTLTIYGKGMTIKGLNMVIERNDSKITGDLVAFNYIDGMRLEDASIVNNTPTNTATYSTLYLNTCRNAYIDGTVESLDATNSIYAYSCERLRGGYVRGSNDGGRGIYLSNCSEIRGFTSLNGQGDGSAGNDIKLEDVLDLNSVLGRIKTDNSLAGLGLDALGTDVDPDEFINHHVHRRGTVSILNNGIYEALISVSLTQIQVLHGTPSVLTPAGVIDGLVSDAIVDSLLST